MIEITSRDHGTAEMYCDAENCDYSEEFEDPYANNFMVSFASIAAEAKSSGWTIKREDGEWAHYCPNCSISEEIESNIDMDKKCVDCEKTVSGEDPSCLECVAKRMTTKETGQLLILGENRVSHIPRDEEISIEIGKAFDIKAERTIINRKRETKNTERLQIAIEFRNRKSEDIEILVTEPVSRSRDYRILDNNFSVHKKDAGKVEFIVPVKGRQSQTLNYEILYSW